MHTMLVNVIAFADKHAIVVAENWNLVICSMYQYQKQIHTKKLKMENLKIRLKLGIHVLRN